MSAPLVLVVAFSALSPISARDVKDNGIALVGHVHCTSLSHSGGCASHHTHCSLLSSQRRAPRRHPHVAAAGLGFMRSVVVLLTYEQDYDLPCALSGSAYPCFLRQETTSILEVESNFQCLPMKFHIITWLRMIILQWICQVAYLSLTCPLACMILRIRLRSVHK
jgi:hypothetical protein